MTRDQLSHVLRAAVRITGDPGILVLGSQAILGTYYEDELPAEAWMSVEVDLAFLDDSDEAKANRVDGAIGEDSEFHATYAYYAQGVQVSVAILPEGWRDRVVLYRSESAKPAEAVCLDPHDTVIAKLAAYREKDLSFAAALLDAGLIDLATLLDRAATIPPIYGMRVRNWLFAYQRKRSRE